MNRQHTKDGTVEHGSAGEVTEPQQRQTSRALANGALPPARSARFGSAETTESPVSTSGSPFDTGTELTRTRIRIEVAEMPDPFAPAAVPGTLAAPAELGPARSWIRARYTPRQLLGGLIVIVGCVVAAVWYVPRVLSTDRSLLSGSVVSGGVVTLNFPSAGEIDQLAVHPGQRVRKGQVLATEYAPDLTPVLSADTTAIVADRARLKALQSARRGKSVPVLPSTLAAVRAELKLDQARLATDRVRLSASRIIAPAAGTVTAANGHRGEAVTAAGIRDYATDTQQAATNQRPAFSLLPEGPQADGHPASTSSLPVVALRTSSSWQVAALVPEGSVSRLSVGERVTVSVPAAHLARVRGRISEIVSSPVATSSGTEYQALVTVPANVSQTPFSGMAADVHLDGSSR